VSRRSKSPDFSGNSVAISAAIPIRDPFLMMVQPPPATSQLQRFANDISARLAQLAKDPPDLLAYLQVHAECLISALRPVGFIYEMQNGTTVQRTLQSNVESLIYRNLPEQDIAFARAVRLSADKRQAVFI